VNAPASALVLSASAVIEDFPVDLTWSTAGDALVAAGGEGGLYRIDAAGASAMLGRHEPGLISAAWQPKGSCIASAGQDGAVRLWNVEDGAHSVAHRGRGWPAGLAWRADGARLAFATGKSVHVFDAEGKALLLLDAHAVTLSHLAWRGRDEVIAAGNGALFVDRIDAGSITQHVLEGAPQSLALSPDLKLAAAGLADGTLNFRYLNLNKRSRMSGYEGKLDQLAWSANSRLLATASTGAGSIVVWDFGGKGPEGSQPLQLTAHEGRITQLVWQIGGPHLVSAGQDWRLVLWKPGPAARQPLDVQRLDAPAALARWSPDGRRLAVASESGKISLYPLRS